MNDKQGHILGDDDSIISEGITILCRRAYEHSVAKGFAKKDRDRNAGECIALMHSELSEALEGARKDIQMLTDKDISYADGTKMKLVEEEMADVIIRVADFCRERKLRLGEAIIRKMEYNKSRPYKHGKEF